jgi:RIO-like serine/threonine protein kinase
MENIKKNNTVFIKKEKSEGSTSDYYISEDGKYFLKKPKEYLDYNILEREIFILKKLQKYETHFPKLVYHDSECLITEYIGEIISKETLPKDYIKQIERILEILQKEEIRHSDIKDSEILVDKKNKIYLVDYGWAEYKKDISCGGMFNNINLVKNYSSDRIHIKKIIRKLLRK